MASFLPLPKELIDIIYEYNPEHRPMYKKVLEELIERYNDIHSCDNCGNELNEEDSIITHIYLYKKRYAYCSMYCKWEFNYDLRKRWKNKQLYK